MSSMTRTQAVLICFGICLFKVVIVYLLAKVFMFNKDGNDSINGELDENGFCLHRNSPLVIPSFSEWNINATESIQLSYKESTFTEVAENGNKLQLFASKTTNYRLSIYQQEFKLDNIFMISPSLHTIDHKEYDLEVQLSFVLDENEDNDKDDDDDGHSDNVIINLLINDETDNHHEANSIFFIPIINAIKDNQEIFVIDEKSEKDHQIRKETMSKADGANSIFNKYFSYLASNSLPPCTNDVEIPQVVIDLNRENAGNSEPMFVKSDDLKKIITYLQKNKEEKNTDNSENKFVVKRWDDLENRALLPIDGILNKFHDNKRNFVDKRSFWRSILLDNPFTKTQIELQLKSYVKQKEVIEQILDSEKYVRYQLAKYHVTQCITHQMDEEEKKRLEDDKEKADGLMIGDENNKNDVDETRSEELNCDELRDLLKKKWEKKRNELICILQPFECKQYKYKYQVDGDEMSEVDLSFINKENLNMVFNIIDNKRKVIEWLLRWFGNVAEREIDGSDHVWNKYVNKDKNNKIHLIKFDAETQRFYYDGFVEKHDYNSRNVEGTVVNQKIYMEKMQKNLKDK